MEISGSFGKKISWMTWSFSWVWMGGLNGNIRYKWLGATSSINGGIHQWGYPQNGGLRREDSIYKWMITRGTPPPHGKSSVQNLYNPHHLPIYRSIFHMSIHWGFHSVYPEIIPVMDDHDLVLKSMTCRLGIPPFYRKPWKCRKWVPFLWIDVGVTAMEVPNSWMVRKGILSKCMISWYCHVYILYIWIEVGIYMA